MLLLLYDTPSGDCGAARARLMISMRISLGSVSSIDISVDIIGYIAGGFICILTVTTEVDYADS
jgi:hypothetical protein